MAKPRRFVASLVFASTLAGYVVSQEGRALGTVTFQSAGNGDRPVKSGDWVAYATIFVPGDRAAQGPTVVWVGPAGGGQRVLGGGDVAPSFPSLTIASIDEGPIVDGTGAVTFAAALSDGASEVVYQGTPGKLSVIAGRGPAVQGMTGLLTTQLRAVTVLDWNALSVLGSDGSLWILTAGKTIALGPVQFDLQNPGGVQTSWSGGQSVGVTSASATEDGAFALSVAEGDGGPGRGVASGTTATDVALVVPITQPTGPFGVVPMLPQRDQAGDLLYALATPSADQIVALELLAGGAVLELGRGGQPTPGLPMTFVGPTTTSISGSGRVASGWRTQEASCRSNTYCDVIWTGTLGNLYPAAAPGYALPGVGKVIDELKLYPGISDKGHFAAAAEIPVPNENIQDWAVYLYEPSNGFVRIVSAVDTVPEVDPDQILDILSAYVPDDDHVFVNFLYGAPVRTAWALATVSGLTPIGTDVAVDPSTGVDAGSATARPDAGHATGHDAGPGASDASTGGRVADAGASSADAAAPVDAAGSDAAPASAGGTHSGGCSCRVASRTAPDGAWPFGIALGLALAGRRALRRRGEPRSRRRVR